MLLTNKVKIKWNGNSRSHYEKLGYIWANLHDEFEVEVNELTPSSTTSVEVECDECNKIINLKWQDYLRRVKFDGKYYCKNCARKLYGLKNLQKTTLSKMEMSFEQWCVVNNKLDILERWSSNNKETPNKVSYGSGHEYYFKCPKGIHRDEKIKINTLTSGMLKGVVCKHCESFAQYLIDTYGENGLELFWDYNKNTLNPWDILKSSKRKVWVKCQEKDYHGSYEVLCGDFYMGRRCSFCGNFKIHPQDSIGKILEEKGLMWIWSDKNKKSPYEYLSGSHDKVYWKCINNKHEEYMRSVKESNRFEFRCPECSEEQKMERMYSLCGENNYNYNPELTDEEREKGRYKLYGESHKKWRKEVFQRDNYTCKCCGKKGGKLNAHHLDGWMWSKDKRYDPDNGVTLCEVCHKKFHNIYGQKNNTKEQYESFLKNSTIQSPQAS